jgi:DNA-binding transcriptional regulator YhcF (GntR family)
MGFCMAHCIKQFHGSEGDERMTYIEIDFSSDEAIYQQLCNQIIQGIAMSRLAEGEVLPSVRQMADEIGINMHTVNKAYTILKQEGYVKVDRRRGAVIALDENRQRAMDSIRKSLRLTLAEAKCRNISREEVMDIVRDIYDSFDEDESADKAGRKEADEG